MDKKGIGHEIDWIIGVGLFILSVTFIFILFKPGVTPVFDSKTLLDIVEGGFNNDVNWKITKVPLFLALASQDHPVNGPVLLDNNGVSFGEPSTIGETYFEKISNLISSITPEDFPKEAYIKIFYVESYGDVTLSSYEVDVDDDNVDNFCSPPLEDLEDFCTPAAGRRGGDHVRDARNRISSYGGISEDERENQLEYFITDENSLIIPASLNEVEGEDEIKVKYIITVADRPINFFRDITPIDEVIYKNGCYAVGEFSSVSDIPPIPIDPVTGELECYAIYELGVSERISGIDLASFLSLDDFVLEGSTCNLGYECVKEAWGFPVLKEFIIKIETIPETTTPAIANTTISEPPTIFKFGSVSPPVNVNVFVRNFNSFILTDDGTKIPVKVTLSVW